MADENGEGAPRFGRRRLLGLLAGAAGAGVATYVGINQRRRQAAQETIQGIDPYWERKNPQKVEPLIINPSETVLNNCYERFFGGKEYLLPKRAWVRVVEDGTGKHTEGIGNNIGSLAYLYYDKEKKPNESVDHFFERFMDQLHRSSQIAQLDFITLITSLQVSGENTRDLKEQKTDVTVSGIQQAAIPAGKALGIDYFAQEALRPGKEFDQLKESSLAGYLPDMPIESRDMNALIRFQSERTTGMMDWESSMRAKAILLKSSNEAKAIFVQKYPDLVRAYQVTLLKLGLDFNPIIDQKRYIENKALQQDTLIKSKRDLEILAREFLEKYKGQLDIFAKDDKALAAIGIGDPIDLWQKYNKTDIWYHLVCNIDKQDAAKTDEKLALADTKMTLKSDFEQRREHYYYQLMSQQILNPKFLPFLIEAARKSNNSFELNLLQKLSDGIDRYQTQAHQVRDQFLAAEKLEGPLEYNSEFQTLSTAVTTKMLSENAGPYDPNDKDSLYWHIFRLVAIREISHPLLVVQESGFAPDITVDPPYVVDKTMESLSQLEQLLIEKGIVEKPAWQNITAFMKAYNTIRDKNFTVFPNLSDNDRNQIETFFDNRVVNTPHIAMNRSQAVVWNLVANQSS